MITEIIEPIKLLSGSHPDTAQTGQGCFMNVIAYLNGEPQITDQSECVCFVVKPIAIWLNDYLRDDERSRLIPFIERAMGSRSDDKEEILRRLKLVVKFSDECAKYAAEYAETAIMFSMYAKYAKHAAKHIKYGAESDAKSADKYVILAQQASLYTTYTNHDATTRKCIIDATFKFLDKALPKQIIENNE